MAGLVEVPMLTTLHGGIAGDWDLLFQHYKGWYNAISKSALSLLPPKNRCVGAVYNAIDFSTYPFNPGPREEFLLYLSRISPEKGTHIAIEVAKQADRKLKIAGNVDDADREYFENVVLPEVDGELIEYVGEADLDMKRDLMSQADCLLAPITWNEPFGLFMVEAMACGVPVITSRAGSLEEVAGDAAVLVEPDDIAGLAGAMQNVLGNSVLQDELSRRGKTRASAFSWERCARETLAVYEKVLS